MYKSPLLGIIFFCASAFVCVCVLVEKRIIVGRALVVNTCYDCLKKIKETPTCNGRRMVGVFPMMYMSRNFT